MKNLYGIWIDHAHAYIVRANELDVVGVTKLDSGVEPHHHSGEDGGERHTMSDQGSYNKRQANQMHTFTKEIVGQLNDANEIIIFGPSTAKHDLKHAIEANKGLAQALTSVETSDTMTENQLTAYVKKHFGLPRS